MRTSFLSREITWKDPVDALDTGPFAGDGFSEINSRVKDVAWQNDLRFSESVVARLRRRMEGGADDEQRLLPVRNDELRRPDPERERLRERHTRFQGPADGLGRRPRRRSQRVRLRRDVQALPLVPGARGPAPRSRDRSARASAPRA